MSHESALAGLKLLMKQSMFDTDPLDHAVHLLKDESDRSTIILHAAMVEASLLHRLQLFMPGLNSEETKEIFDFEGPIGSFSNRIRLAHALEIIDRPTRRKIDMLRVMRNVAAHAHTRLTFKTPQVAAGVSSLFGQPDDALDDWDNVVIRELYGVSCNALSHTILHAKGKVNWTFLWKKGGELQAKQPPPSPGK